MASFTHRGRQISYQDHGSGPSVLVLIHGLLGQGVAASSRFDPQAKGLGEWARSRLLEVPEELL